MFSLGQCLCKLRLADPFHCNKHFLFPYFTKVQANYQSCCNAYQILSVLHEIASFIFLNFRMSGNVESGWFGCVSDWCHQFTEPLASVCFGIALDRKRQAEKNERPERERERESRAEQSRAEMCTYMQRKVKSKQVEKYIKN